VSELFLNLNKMKVILVLIFVSFFVPKAQSQDE